MPQIKGAFSSHVEHAEENSPVSSSWLDPVADISSGADSPSPRSDIPSLEEDDCDSWLQPAPSTSQAPDSIIPQNTASDEIMDLDELISDAQPAASFLSFSGRWVKVGQARSKPQDDSGDKPEDTRDPKPPKQRIQEWVCPVCRLVIKGQHIPSLKAQHLRTRHPEFDKKLVQVPRKSEVVAMSHAIPEEQRDFTCPLCKKGLCALPKRERQRAIAEHCKEHHPDYTAKQLTNLSQKGRPKKSRQQSNNMREKLEKQRNEKHATHSCVMLPRYKNSSDRGRIPFCKVCLCVLNRMSESVAKLTCQESLDRLKSDPRALRGRKLWWEGVKQRDPEWARTLLLETGWEQTELETFLTPTNPRPTNEGY